MTIKEHFEYIKYQAKEVLYMLIIRLMPINMQLDMAALLVSIQCPATEEEILPILEQIVETTSMGYKPHKLI